MSSRDPVNDITAEHLRSVVDYNPETGKFFYGSGPSFGKEIRTRHNRGYLKITVKGRNYLAHRLAWLYVHGEWPHGVIDHINCIKTDNRIANLRDVAQQENIRLYWEEQRYAS